MEKSSDISIGTRLWMTVLLRSNIYTIWKIFFIYNRTYEEREREREILKIVYISVQYLNYSHIERERDRERFLKRTQIEIFENVIENVTSKDRQSKDRERERFWNLYTYLFNIWIILIYI